MKESMKKILFMMGAAIMVMTAWLFAQLYLYNEIASQESDFCIWTSLARQLLDFGLAPGDLVTYYNRSIVDLLVALLVVPVFGMGAVVTTVLFALPYAVAFALAGGIVAVLGKGRNGRFDWVSFALFNLLAGALFHYNTGHALTFSLVVMVYGVLSFAERLGRRTSWVALVVVSFLGYVNDDFFMLMAVMPVAALNVVQFLFSRPRRVNLLSIPVLVGTGLGAGALKILRAMKLIDYPSVDPSLYPLDRMMVMLLETIKAYASNFGVLNLMKRPLELSTALPFAVYGIVFALSVLAVLYALRRIVSRRLDSSCDLDVVILLAIGAVTAAYAFIASPTKPVGEMVPRYVYYGMVLMLLLLARWWRSLLPTRRLRGALLVVILLFVGFAVHDNVFAKRSNVHARDRYVKMVERLRAEGIRVAYAEWWTAKAFEAAAKGSLRVYPSITSPHAIAPMDMYCLRRVYGERCHAFIVPLYRGGRYHYPADVAEASLRRQLGNPDKVLSDEWFDVFVYDKDIAFNPKSR